MSDRLRLATFNLESLDDRVTSPAFADRIEVLRPQLERLSADILCLQEVNARETRKHGPRVLSALDRLVEGTVYGAYHRAVSLNRPEERPSDKHNLVILSRLPILESRQYWHDRIEAPLYRPVTALPEAEAPEKVEWDRPALHAEIALPSGRRLHVFNLHLRAPRAALIAGRKIDAHAWSDSGAWAEGFFLAAIKRTGQALEARLAVERLFDAEADPLIAVAGDFNASDREMPVRTLRADEEDTGNGRLAGRVLVPADRAIPESQRYSVVHHGRRQMVDHILLSRALMGHFVAAELHNEGLGDELVSPALIKGAPDSYHAPLVASFRDL